MHVYGNIVGHVGTLNTGNKNYKDLSFNLKVEWMNGTFIEEPLITMAEDNTITCTRYGMSNSLFNELG